MASRRKRTSPRSDPPTNPADHAPGQGEAQRPAGERPSGSEPAAQPKPLDPQQQAVLAGVLSQLLASPDPRPVISDLCQRVASALQCDIFYNYLAEEQQPTRLHLHVHCGMPEDAMKEVQWLDQGCAVCGMIPEGQDQLVVENICETRDPRNQRLWSLGIRTCACHLLSSQGKPLGTLSFASRIKEHFSEEDLALMKAVADHVALAIDRERAMEALRRSRQKIASILGSITDCYYALDREWRFLEINDQALHYFGKGREELLGRCLWEVLPTTVGSAFDQQYHRAVAEQVAVHFETLSTLAERWVEIHAYPSAEGLEVYFRDITQQTRTRQQLEAANRAKEHFLAILSHELRTPLTPVLASVQMIQRDAALTPAIRESLELIRRNVELEARLVDDLLDLTRISRGRLRLEFQTVDLHEKLQQVLEVCDSDVRSKQINLWVRLGAEHHHVRGDPARLQQILWNLLKNAIKFTPSGGSIWVSTEAVDGAVSVTVRDTGVGIEPEMLGSIFNAFEQGGKDVSRLFGGLGLGLSISKALVDLHGGSIAAESAGKGHGATFTMRLPAVVAEPSAAVGAAGGPMAPLSGRVLLVEDHPDTAKTMRLLLESYGCEVRVADSVAAALRAAAAEDFDLLISDLGLPDGSGHDLMRQLSARQPIKGLALSGFGAEEDLRKSRESGFTAHLTKPINIQALEETIRAALAR